MIRTGDELGDEELGSGQVDLAALPSDITLTAEITAANQTVTINKYFTNTHTINR